MMIEMKSSLQGLIGSAGIIRVADLAEWQTLHLTTVAIVNIMFPKTSGREYAKLVERNKLIKVGRSYNKKSMNSFYKTIMQCISQFTG